MLQAILMGLVGGQRAMTPLAAVSVAAAQGKLPRAAGALPLLGSRKLAVAGLALAVGEMVGDKWRSAPDRIEPAGLVARFITSATAGATALAASWFGWRARMKAMESRSQAATGFVEDTAVLGSAAAVMRL